MSIRCISLQLIVKAHTCSHALEKASINREESSCEEEKYNDPVLQRSDSVGLLGR
jgi:hypothetical protein